MPAPKPTLSRVEFEALVRRSGLTLSPAQIGEAHAAFGYIEAMAERVRAGGSRPRESEPVLTFKPTIR